MFNVRLNLNLLRNGYGGEPLLNENASRVQ